MSEVVWSPSPDSWKDSAYVRFAAGAGFDPLDYEAVHRWSVGDPGAFWSRLWDFAGIVGEKGTVALQHDPEHWMTGARFFPGAAVNLAENLLAKDEIGVVERDEAGNRRSFDAAALRADVARIANGLRAAGVCEGDRVATVLPNRYEALVVLLATAAVGGVWTSCSPDFGMTAILDRIGQVAPKVLFSCGSVRYGGKDVQLVERVAEVAAGIDSLTCLVQVGAEELRAPVPVVHWDEFGGGEALEFSRVAFDAPLFILYTSGTTGKPKAIVHKTGGVLMQLVKEHLLHGDVRPGDRLLWYSNTAWMMYPWMVGSLSQGATVGLYDGAPVLRDGGGFDCTPLWRAVEEERLTHLGISPKYLATLSDQGFVPKEHFDTSSLRWLLSAGSPMGPWQYDWMYDSIGDMGFASISGGTEIMGCFLLGLPTKPVRKGTLTVKALGMAVNVFDERGAPVIGRPGELVCTEPFPSMPRTFWGENGDQRYRDAYFAERDEIWTHGDHATLNADGTAVIHGRSDFTLNPGGVRIGTADIYNVCERFDEIEDCIVFGRPVEGDEEIVLCLQMASGHEATPDLAKAVRAELRRQCSPRHVPAAIYTVAAIPYTINSKRVEGAAKAMATGADVKNKASLANPECLDEYAKLDGRSPL